MSEIQVQDVMSELVTTVAPEDTIHEAAEQLARNSVSGMPVVTGTRVVGMVSESDIIWALTPEQEREAGMTILDFMMRFRHRDTAPNEHLRVRDIMSTLVASVSPYASIWKAASIMHSRGIKRLPVTDNEGHLVGIVSRADLIQAIAHDNTAVSDIQEAIRVSSE